MTVADVADRSGWPDKVNDYRPGQAEAVGQIVDLFMAGYRTVMLEGPTGSGKTIVANGARLELGLPATYSCHSLGLQDQVQGDFGKIAAILKGRSNYVVDVERGATAADCTWAKDSPCRWCPEKRGCPYEVAKREAIMSDFRVMNHALLVTEARFIGRIPHKLMILDEVELMEGVLQGAVEVAFSPRLREELGLGRPRYVTKPESVQEWLTDEVAPALAKKIGEFPPEDRCTVKQLRYRKRLVQLLAQVAWVGEHMDDGWVFDHRSEPWAVKPIGVGRWGAKWLGGADLILGMSATLIDPEGIAGELGLPGPVGVVRMESTFPVENRPIDVFGLVNVRHGMTDNDFDILATLVRGIMRRHPDERILVHCHTYRIAGELDRRLRDGRVITYRGAQGRETALAAYLERPAAVLLAPSLERGVSLDDDACRVQIICKIPYANTKDPLVAARLYGRGRYGQQWYALDALRGVVQMTGRGVRHPEDWAHTYVLDAQFIRLHREWSRFFPQWWARALNFRCNVKALLREGRE